MGKVGEMWKEGKVGEVKDVEIWKNVLVDPNKYEYNLQSMSRDKTKSFWN